MGIDEGRESGWKSGGEGWLESIWLYCAAWNTICIWCLLNYGIWKRIWGPVAVLDTSSQRLVSNRSKGHSPFNKVIFYYWIILLNATLGQPPKTFRNSNAIWSLNHNFSIRQHRLNQVPGMWKTKSTSERYSLLRVTYKFPSKEHTMCAKLIFM